MSQGVSEYGYALFLCLNYCNYAQTQTSNFVENRDILG